MTDVYFITRYVQLRDRVTYPTERGTLALIRHLGEAGSLDAGAAQQLFDGYLFLRRLDHWMRLLLDRPTSVLPASQTALADLVRSLELDSLEAFEREYDRHTTIIRTIFSSVFTSI
jgi:[glutamine synthetase] adenylyltransferase / [glutamine synthetase]-adenylyl-L-tyrosine phosphorylase